MFDDLRPWPERSDPRVPETLNSKQSWNFLQTLRRIFRMNLLLLFTTKLKQTLNSTYFYFSPETFYKLWTQLTFTFRDKVETNFLMKHEPEIKTRNLHQPENHGRRDSPHHHRDVPPGRGLLAPPQREIDTQKQRERTQSRLKPYIHPHILHAHRKDRWDLCVRDGQTPIHQNPFLSWLNHVHFR